VCPFGGIVSTLQNPCKLPEGCQGEIADQQTHPYIIPAQKQP
jgi:hypothetical protein